MSLYCYYFAIICIAFIKSTVSELIPDEFGYWTYAATLSGCDWSDIVSLGSYYSFGYTLILYPIFQIFQDSIVAYRAAVTVNFLLMILAYFVLLKKYHEITGRETEDDFSDSDYRNRHFISVMVTLFEIYHDRNRSYEYVHYHMHANDSLFRQS